MSTHPTMTAHPTSCNFQCPFTGTQHTSYAACFEPGAAGHRAAERTAPSLHPMLAAKLHPQAESQLTLHWSIWRTLWRLHTKGWLTYTAPITGLEACHPRTLHIIAEAGESLLREGARDGRLKRLPAYAHGAECTPGSVANWLAYCSELRAGTADASEPRAGASERYSTREEELEALRCELAARIARNAHKNLALRASINKVADIMEDLSVQSGWDEQHTQWLIACTNKKNVPALPCLLAVRDKLQEYYPQQDVVGHRAMLDCELVLQQVSALLLEAARVAEMRALCEEEEAEALAVASSVRTTYQVTSTQDAKSILPVGHSTSKSANDVAKKLRAALAAQNKLPAPAAERPSVVPGGMAALLAKARAAQAARNEEEL